MARNANVTCRWMWACAASLVLLPLLRVAGTHRVFSATADEPVHIAAGYDWLARGVYVLDVEHPPLARAFFGVGLRAGGVVMPPPAEKTLQPIWATLARGTELLWNNGRYVHNLARARQGNLVFLLAALIAVGLWARRCGMATGIALAAVALFGSLPPILAHAGLATTDMALAATLPLALLALDLWLERATPFRALLLGLAIGAGLSAKFSFLLFFAVSGAVVVIVRRKRPRMISALLACAVAGFVVWSAYAFEWGTLADVTPRIEDVVGERGAWIARNVPMPAPAFVAGVISVRIHQQRGHGGFLLGEWRDTGWWYYFPAALFFKTPLPFLLLFLIGAAALIRTRAPNALLPVLIPIVLLLAVLPARLNIGVRHILVVFPFMAVAAAFGASVLWRASRTTLGRTALVVLVAWYAIGTSLAHPDYLAWFNEAAGRHPERILGDSNLDWGQDVLRLAKAAREEKIEHLSLLIFGNADLDRIGLPPHQLLLPNVPTHGWIAVSETALQSSGDAFVWLERHRPVRRVGKSIRLYHVP